MSLGRLAGGRVSVGLVKPRFLTKQSLFCLQWCTHWVNTGNALLLFMMGAPIVCVCVVCECGHCALCCQLGKQTSVTSSTDPFTVHLCSRYHTWMNSEPDPLSVGLLREFLSWKFWSPHHGRFWVCMYIALTL